MALGKPQPGGLDPRQHFRPEDLGQGFVVEQIGRFTVARPLGAPSLARAVNHDRRHDQMDMRVIRQLARVRMQHRDGTGGALKLLVVVAEGAHRRPGTTQQQFVEDTLVGPAQRPEFSGQGEGE